MKEVKPSENFKKQARKAVWAIMLFVFSYCILASLAIGLTALCVYLGIQIVIAVPKLVTLGLGLGLASLGFLVLIFLFKFIFRSHKTGQSHFVEITRETEPFLFDLVEDIVAEVGTDFPKKIYVSAEINASVFYNSNFWSMFLPVRKNLHIGMGLVNTVTVNELKAILAHEFGHFSQRSMKVGSYVYNVNQVIYNMLYDNESFDKLVEKWAAASGYFFIFVIIAVKIVEGIQWMLRKLYNVVNISYMGLSREMEFHADEIAAGLCGYIPMQDALLRLDLAEYALNSSVQFYAGTADEKIKSPNIFKEQAFAMNFLAEEEGIPVENGFPKVSPDHQNRFNKSKLVIKDQWASHPSTEDRIARLKILNVGPEHGEADHSGANTLFKEITRLQETFTEKIFAVGLGSEEEVKTYALQDFKTAYVSKYRKNTFDELYNNYYDNKNPEKMAFDGDLKGRDGNMPLSALFSAEKVDLVYVSLALQNDIGTLTAIVDKDIRVKSFDYDGKRYKRKESVGLMQRLKDNLEKVREKIKDNDINIFMYFEKLEKESGGKKKLKEMYKALYTLDEDYDSRFEIYLKLTEGTQFVNYTTPFEEIKSNFRKLENTEEKLKEAITELLSRENIETEMNNEMKTNFERYLSKKWQYFGNEKYFDDHLKILFTALEDFYYLMSREFFLQKKGLLDYQATLFQSQLTTTSS